MFENNLLRKGLMSKLKRYFEILKMNIISICQSEKGSAVAQWLSGRVLDSRSKGLRFELYRRHCVVSLSKTHSS